LLVLAVLAGLTGILFQWQRAEVARRDAVASDAEAQQLLAELIQSSPVVPLRLEYDQGLPRIEPLLEAEAHCQSLLQKNPGNTGIRIALTNVCGRLGTVYLERVQ